MRCSSCCDAARSAARPSTGPSRSKSLRISIDSDWAPADGARLSAGPLRHHEPRRRAGHRDRRAGHRGSSGRCRRSGQAASTVRQTVRLARGDRVRLTMPVPVFADNENIRFEIREKAPHARAIQLRRLPEPACRRPTPRCCIVADRGHARSAHRRQLGAADEPRGRGTPPRRRRRSAAGACVARAPRRGCPPLDFVLEPARLPTNWLGFTSLRAVVIGRDRVGAAERGAEERAPDLDGVRRRPDLRRRRSARAVPRRQARRLRRGSHAPAISSAAFTCRRRRRSRRSAWRAC